MIYKQIAVRLPRLLDKDLNEVTRLRARAQTVEMNITPLSTASLTLEDGSGIAIRSFVELYNAKGSAGIYRVSLPEESYGGGERISLEHGICTLDDAIVPGKGEISGTPRSVLSLILTHQTTKARGQNFWTLGTVEAPDSMQIVVEHDGTKTLEMLSKVMSELADYMLTFDQSRFPWVVNVVRKPQIAACEGRLSRNVRTIRKTVDDSDLCTRLYCSLLDSGYIESDTVSAWGVVENSITLNDSMSQPDVLAYCRKYLENRKNPAVAIEMDADEWFVMTGERIDRFEVGDICRLALPDYGVVIEERIVALNYMDALGRPEAVTVSLANQIMDMSIKTAEISQSVDSLKGTSVSYGNRIRSSETKITNLKDTQEDIEKLNGKMTHWFNSVEIDLDAETATIGLLASRNEVTAVSTRLTQAEIDIDGANANILLKADATTVDAMGKRVSAAEIEIDGLNSEITLKADKVTIDAQITSINNLLSGKSTIALAAINTLRASYTHTAYLYVDGDEASWESFKVVTGGKINWDVAEITVRDGMTLRIPASFSFSPSTDWIYYLGK